MQLFFNFFFLGRAAEAEWLCIMSFVIPCENVVEANTARRYMLNSISRWAAHRVEIVENTTLLTDEMIAFYLAWAPLKTEVPGRPGDVLTQAIDLVVTGAPPRHNQFEVIRMGRLNLKSDNFKIPDDHMPLFKIQDQERLHLRIDVRCGTGYEHCKYCPIIKAGVEILENHKVNLHVHYQPWETPEVLQRELHEQFARECQAALTEIKGCVEKMKKNESSNKC